MDEKSSLISKEEVPQKEKSPQAPNEATNQRAKQPHKEQKIPQKQIFFKIKSSSQIGSQTEDGSDEEFEGDYADLQKVKKTQHKRMPNVPESLDYSPSFTLPFTPIEKDNEPTGSPNNEEPKTNSNRPSRLSVMKQEEYRCLVARSALILPFKWANPIKASMTEWIDRLLNRKLISPKNEELRIWQVSDKIPFEVGDLDPHFRRLVGWKEDLDEYTYSSSFKESEIFENSFMKQSFFEDESEVFAKPKRSKTKQKEEKIHLSNVLVDINTQESDFMIIERNEATEATTANKPLIWEDPMGETCKRLEVSPEVQALLFQSPRICALCQEEPDHDETKEEVSISSADIQESEIFCLIEIKKVELVIYPLGTASLVFHINWLPPGQSMSIDELRTWLFLAKFTHKVPGVCKGWRLVDEVPVEKLTKPPDSHYNSLGKKLTAALYEMKPISLKVLGNWLLCGCHEDVDNPPKRLGRYQKRCYHHTVVVIDREPHPTQLTEYLFHLRRAYGQRNRPQTSTLVEQGSIDKVLIQRLNRYVGISRVGAVSLSWPTNNKTHNFEVNQWYKKWMGIYLVLALHVHGEKSVLLELSNLSAACGQLLRRVTHVSLKEMSVYRQRLIELATLMTRYTLQMSSDDCGGLSEYIEFFIALRDIFGTKPQRQELREEIQEVMALVESNYLEEQRKMRNLERSQREKDERRRRWLEHSHAVHQARFERWIAAVTTFTLPIVLVSGLFGMNNDDLPRNWPFWPVVGVTLCFSLILLVIVGCLSRRLSLRDRSEKEELNNLM
jgi:hypothetical protein